MLLQKLKIKSSRLNIFPKFIEKILKDIEDVPRFPNDLKNIFLSSLGHVFIFTKAIMARDFESFVSYWNAFEGCWYSIWTEIDYLMVISAFHSTNVISWKNINLWLNYFDQFKNMSFTIFYIFREGNAHADRVTNHGLLSLISFGRTRSLPFCCFQI